MNDLVIPGYTIKRALGRGGMATVYLAEQDKFERDVALKVMSPSLSADEGFRERFLREAKIVAKISHPNIVAVYDVNEVNGVYYIAMEYHPGGDLKARIREGLSVREALQVAREVARALDFAHAKGYLHRDIKPDNVLFRDDGSAVLTDFGIAKATEGDASLTQMGMVAGTPKYMSPEQARAQQLDAASDLYSLGVVLFEMLTGRLPFEAGDAIALGIMHMNAPVPRLEGRLAHFQPLLDRLLAKQPAQRPQSGMQVIREIDALEKSFDYGATEPGPGDTPTQLRPSMRTRSAPAPAAAVAAGADDATVLNPAALPAPVSAPMPGTVATPAPATGKGGAGRVAAAAAVVVVLGAGAWWATRQPSPPAATPPVTAAPSADAAAAEGAARLRASLDAGAAALARGALVGPDVDNALAHYRAALALQPGNTEASAGVHNVVSALQAEAYDALAARRVDEAARLLAQASEIEPGDGGHVPLQRAIEAARAGASRGAAARQASLPPAPSTVAPAPAQPAPDAAPDALARLRISGMLGSARQALEDGDTATAVQRYEQVLKLEPGNREARDGLRQARAR